MKVLHLTNWYPTSENRGSAIWIKRHIDALSRYCENTAIHVEVLQGSWRFSNSYQLFGNLSIVLKTPIKYWWVREVLTSLLLLWTISRVKLHKYDIINFHIAYPLGTYLHLIKRFIKQPIVINEHWSAYHYNFHISNASKTSRIRRIFHNNIFLVTVSEALAADIINFSGNRALQHYVVPNVVDTKVFRYTTAKAPSNVLFMLSLWKDPKDPITLIRAFASISDTFPELTLRIAGFGPMENEIKSQIKISGSEERIHYLGRLTSSESAMEMSNALAFLHGSAYETFSVVCAEAICCGLPVIASKVGGIPEFIDDSNGILVDSNTTKAWQEAILRFMQSREEFDRQMISSRARSKFDIVNVGATYYKTLERIKFREKEQN